MAHGEKGLPTHLGKMTAPQWVCIFALQRNLAECLACHAPICRFTDSRSDCDAVLEAYSLGHELATHTVSHPNK